MKTNVEYEPVNFALTLTPMTCGTCGGAYALARDFIAHCQKVGRSGGATWRCPYCKVDATWGYGDSEVDRLKREVNAAKEREQFAERRLQSERSRRQYAERSRNAYKGQATKIKARVGKGVCPCCNRHFVALERHMANKHPEFADAQPRGDER